MCWADAVRLLTYWRRHPPLHELAASFIGYRPPADSGAAADDAGPEATHTHNSQAFAALLAAHGLPAALLDEPPPAP